MLNYIGQPGYESLSVPKTTTIMRIADLLKSNSAPTIAEIGVGIGCTTLAICERLDNRGELHVFDFEDKVTPLKADLAKRGFTNVAAFGNSRRYWDSYHWPLMMLARKYPQGIYDYIFLDGAHTFLHDALAFTLCDRLLKAGGMIDFDDYSWRFSRSVAMKKVRHRYMTDKQMRTPQVKLVVDMFVKPNPRYAEVDRNRSYRKLRSEY